MIYFQKSPVKRDSQQLNHKKAQKPVFRDTIPNVFARWRRHLGFFYWGSCALGIRQQSRSPISMFLTYSWLLRSLIQSQYHLANDQICPHLMDECAAYIVYELVSGKAVLLVRLDYHHRQRVCLALGRKTSVLAQT